MSLDVVYTLQATTDDCAEMRYSLRSLAANVPHSRVIVLQDRPGWARNIEFLPVKHTQTPSRFDRVRNNMRALLEWDDCPQAFALWNDDFFRMMPLDRYEHMHRHIDMNRPLSTYCQQIARTQEHLRAHGLGDLIYEVHAPIIVEADKLRHTFDLFASFDGVWQWRTAYGNVARLDSEQVQDPKVHKRADQFKADADWISTGPMSWRGRAGRYIRTRYPDPSPYERA